MTFSALSRHVLAAVILTSAVGVPAMAQEDAARPVDGGSPTQARELLADWIHYTLIAHVELANAKAQALIDTGVTNAELATMLDEVKDFEQRFQQAVDRAMMVPEMEPIAGDLMRRAEAGRLDLARDPQRIEEAVKMLGQSARARTIGRTRLLAAKEFAVPVLLRQITDGTDPALKVECQRVLVELGPDAVAPLSVAAGNLTGANQRIVADILGAIGNPVAAPYLREISMNDAIEQETRDAAKRAFDRLGVPDAPLSTLYTNLAVQYFDGFESLIAFPEEPYNNVWRYNNFTGLSPQPVPTPIFGDVRSMELSSKAVTLDPTNAGAISLFVASDLKRENDLPDGATDPVYGDNKYTADFYATVFGTRTCLDVLGMAIDRLNTPLVRDAIAALSKTTGGANLFARSSSRQPLLEALGYPDRRVQYEAALTLAHALPQQRFDGDQQVVPILASAVRQGAKSLALLVVENEENRANASTQLQALGFDIVGAGANAPSVQPDVLRAVGVDLVLVRMSSAEAAQDAVDSLRRLPKVAAAPIVIVASATDVPSLNREYRSDQRVIVTQARDESTIANAIERVMASGAGGRITEAESEEYAIRSLAALRDVAISRSPAYTIGDAQSALIDALDTRTGGTKMLVADILALIDTEAAQRKLFDAALATTDEAEKAELLDRVSDSIRLFGDKVEERHVTALLDLITNSEGDVAEAAASVHGSLNLPTSGAVKLLPEPTTVQ